MIILLLLFSVQEIMADGASPDPPHGTREGYRYHGRKGVVSCDRVGGRVGRRT